MPNNEGIAALSDDVLTKRQPTQQRVRSERMRKRLIDVTIACLVRYGYARTNPLRVAAEAGVTRGAVLHHFANGPDLIRASIVELHEKRLRALGRVTDIDVSQTGTMLRIYWEQLSSPTAIAFQELRGAARTDEALAAILDPLEYEYQHRWDSRARNIFADWQRDPEGFNLAITLAQTILEGLAVRRQSGVISERTIDLMLVYLEQRLAELHPDRRGVSRHFNPYLKESSDEL
jgi:AcrR family transcriptional regulator